MNRLKKQYGFILVEFIITLILIGILGSFAGFFMYTGISGYLNAKRNAEGALQAQVALDRISMELRDISAISEFIENSSIEYSSFTLPDTRTILFNSGSPNNISIKVVTAVTTTESILINNVDSFALVMGTANLDNDAGGSAEVAGISVDFTLTDIGIHFKTEIYPRDMIPAPP